MCEVDKDINLGYSDDNEVIKQDIEHSFETDLKDLPEVLSFIQRLQDCIVRQRRIILRLSEKCRNEVNKICCIAYLFCLIIHLKLGQL